MANDINVVMIIGRMTKDAEIKFTQAGSAVCSFSVANNRTYMAGSEKKESVSFINCVAWGKLGEAISKYATKGKQIAVTGHLQSRSWEDKNGGKRYQTEIIVDNFQLLTPKDKEKQTSFEDAKPIDEFEF